MKIDVSDGEIVDKYSILCLKLDRIFDNTKRLSLLHEKQLLQEESASIIERFPLYYHLLCYINQVIWEKTDILKQWTYQHRDYALLASEIFAYNDRRFRLKHIWNQKSHVKEQKSYPQKTVTIEATCDIAILISLVLEYDHLWIIEDDSRKQRIEQTIPSCCFTWIPQGHPTGYHQQDDIIQMIEAFISDTSDK